MAAKHLQRDMVLESGGATYAVLRVSPGSGIVTVLSLGDHSEKHLKISEVRAGIASGAVRIKDSPTIPGGRDATIVPIATARKLADRKLILEQVRRRQAEGHSIVEATNLVAQKPPLRGDGTMVPVPSSRTVARWCETSAAGASLIPAHHRKGNRTPRHPEALVALIKAIATDYYFKAQSRYSLANLTHLVNLRAIEQGLCSPNDPQVSTKAVKKIIVDHLYADLDTKRLDPRTVRALKAVAAQRIVAGLPLSRVEQDGLHLPFIAKTRTGTTEELYLLHAIDCGTSMPVGWNLVVGQPDVDETFTCIERIFTPKRAIFDSLGIKSEVDPYGGPLALYYDNGPENAGERIERLSLVGFDPNRLPVNSPHRKPFIERLNRSLKEALQVLPGCTRLNGKDGARKADAYNEGLMTVEELERWIVRWYYEHWAHQPIERFVTAHYELNEDAGITPAARWKYYASRDALPLPPSPEEWALARFVPDKRVLSAKTGVSLQGEVFKGPALRGLIQQYGPGAKVDVLWNPSDYRYVFVPDRRTKELLRLINAEVDENTPAYSFRQAKEQRKWVRERGAYTSEASETFKRDLHAAGTKKPARGAPKKAEPTGKEAHRYHRAQQRAAGDPLPPKTGEAEVFDDGFIADDAIPVLKTDRHPGKSRK